MSAERDAVVNAAELLTAAYHDMTRSHAVCACAPETHGRVIAQLLERLSTAVERYWKRE